MNIKIRGYIFKHHFSWLGWYLVKKESQPFYYLDDNPYATLYSETTIPYLTIGFTRNGVTKRMRRYAMKHFNKE